MRRVVLAHDSHPMSAPLMSIPCTNCSLLDEQRKTLRDLIEKPLPIVNRPLMPTYAMLAAVDQVHQVSDSGTICA